MKIPVLGRLRAPKGGPVRANRCAGAQSETFRFAPLCPEGGTRGAQRLSALCAFFCCGMFFVVLVAKNATFRGGWEVCFAILSLCLLWRCLCVCVCACVFIVVGFVCVVSLSNCIGGFCG